MVPGTHFGFILSIAWVYVEAPGSREDQAKAETDEELQKRKNRGRL